MYIKQIIIKSFKSYRDITVIEPFDKGFNVIVGKNGSGKSNFFSAIEFVLSDECTHLRTAERLTFLHESTGAAIISGYIELIIDNSDGIIPVETENVSIRREFNAKKDQYFLNKKLAPRSEIRSLLESCGFSVSNSYYIVKQGKINEIATSPDAYRLKLLRGVAGSRVYEEKLEESLNVLNETKLKMDKVAEFRDRTAERLGIIQHEKEELEEYLNHDKIKRTLEYVIYEYELANLKNKLAEVEIERKAAGDFQSKLIIDFEKIQNNIKALAKSNKETKDSLKALNDDNCLKNKDFQLFTEEKAKLEFSIRDLKIDVEGDFKLRASTKKELNELETIIFEKENELTRVKTLFEDHKRKEDECKRELDFKEQTRKGLYAKEGRGNQFHSKKERNKWINTELRTLRTQLENKRKYESILTKDLEEDTNNCIILDKKIKNNSDEMILQRNLIESCTKQYYGFKKNAEKLEMTRKQLWRQENDLQQKLPTLREDLSRLENALISPVGKATINGMESVKKVLELFLAKEGPQSEVFNSYYGLVIDNFSCAKDIYTAVEVTAGNRLFNHIVKSDAVATKILKEMNRLKLPGLAVFMPLNRLFVHNMRYPEPDDFIPLIWKLDYNKEKFDLPMRKIFGNTLICKSLEIATKNARNFNMNCVTLQGDQVSCKGFLTGGHYNTNRSQMELWSNKNRLMNRIDEYQQELGTVRNKIENIQKGVTDVISEVQKTEQNGSKAKAIYDQLRSNIQLMKVELTNIKKNKISKERKLESCTSSIESMKLALDDLKSELDQELLDHLSTTDQHKMNSLNDEIDRLNREYKEAYSARMQLEPEINKSENFLENNLVKKKAELEEVLEKIALENKSGLVTVKEIELKEIHSKFLGAKEELKVLDNQLKECTEKLKLDLVRMDTLKKQEMEAQENFNKKTKDLEKFASEQNRLERNISECKEKVNQLGPFPPQDLYQQYQNMNRKALCRELDKTKINLKKYDQLNRRALEQFTKCVELKEMCQKKYADMEKDLEKIEEMLATVAQQKSDMIIFTFKQVSKYFKKVFKKLVPEGQGQLVIKTADGNDGDLTVENSDSIIGIGIKVAFTKSELGDLKELNQLSGGQKSLVALALIFSIQLCDPAPFYLFDEVDQAMDPEYRAAVGKMIQELSQTAQFIVTTFRPELLVHANKFYGIKHISNVSHVACVSKEDALDFVEENEYPEN